MANAIAFITVTFDSNITKVSWVGWDKHGSDKNTTYETTASGQQIQWAYYDSLSLNDVVSFTVTLNEGYVIDTISINDGEITPTNKTDTTFDSPITYNDGPNSVVITSKKKSFTTLDLSTLNLETGTHTIKVKAKGDGYADSAFSNEVSYIVLPQLEPPTISLNGNLLSSSTVAHATSYDIYCNNTLLATVNTVSISNFDLSGYITTEGSYTIYAIAKATNYKDSPHSNEVTYTVASTPTGYNLTVVQGNYGGTLGITKADGTTSNVGGNTTVANVVSINTVTYEGYASQSLTPNILIPYTLTEDLTITIYSECFIEGTPITLSNHTYKNVEDITYDDNLLVWDFDKGEFSQAKPLWIMKQKKTIKYNHLVFSDNSELNTVEQHRIFNIEKGMFTYPMTEDTPISTHTLNDKGEIVELVSKEVIEKEVNYYNIITNYHINLFAGHILTSCRLSNIYPIKDFKYVKDNREIIPLEKFDVPKEYYVGLRLGEQPTNINRDNADYHGDNSVEDYVKRLIRDKK